MISLIVDKGKVLIEGMDLSGKTTIVDCLRHMMQVKYVQSRTLIENNYIHDFAVQQSKAGNLPRQLISELYKLAIMEDLCKYEMSEGKFVLQDSYFALRSYAYEKDYGSSKIANEIQDYLQMFPKPEVTFYLTASMNERVKRNEKRNKKMAYMEKLLITEPKKFEKIEQNLMNVTMQLFETEIINTEGKSPLEIAQYIKDRIKIIKKNDYSCVRERIY